MFHQFAKPLAVLLVLAASSASGVLAQEREWILDVADEDAYLAFGVPETDDVGVSLWCKIGSGKLKLFVPDGSASLEPGKPADFTVQVGAVARQVTGQAMANDMSGQTSVEAEFPVEDPLIAALFKEDRLSITVKEHQLAFPLADADLEALLKLCTLKSN